MAHTQKPDFVFRRNGRVHLNRRRRHSVDYWQPRCAHKLLLLVVMLDTPCSEVVWRVLATHSIRQFPLHFPSRASPCAITFQLDYTISCHKDHSTKSQRRVVEEGSKRHFISGTGKLNVITNSPRFARSSFWVVRTRKPVDHSHKRYIKFRSCYTQETVHLHHKKLSVKSLLFSVRIAWKLPGVKFCTEFGTRNYDWYINDNSYHQQTAYIPHRAWNLAQVILHQKKKGTKYKIILRQFIPVEFTAK